MGDDLKRRIGERLRAARQARGLSLSELARATGDVLGKPRISNYEQGLRGLGSDEAAILVAALGNVSADELLSPHGLSASSPTEERLLLLYRSAPPEQRPGLIEAVHALVHPPPEPAPKEPRRPRTDADTAQAQAAERWPDLILDRQTYVSAPRIATWTCRRHDEAVRYSLRALLASTDNPCPTCRALDQSRARQAKRADPHAEQNLALLATTEDARAVQIYRLWLAGELQVDIARGLGITPQAVEQRLQKIRKMLGNAGQGGD